MKKTASKMSSTIIEHGTSRRLFLIGSDMFDDHQLIEFLISDTSHDEELVQPTPDSHQQPT